MMYIHIILKIANTFLVEKLFYFCYYFSLSSSGLLPMYISYMHHASSLCAIVVTVYVDVNFNFVL